LNSADQSAPVAPPRRVSLEAVQDALIGSAVLVTAEWIWVSFAARAEFAGPWEFADALVGVVPLAWIVASLGALGGAMALRLARSPERRARTLLGVLVALAGAALGVGMTTGRHFSALAVRASFVALLAVLGFAAAYWAGPRVAGVTSRSPRKAALGAALLAVALSAVNYVVLPRLYPAFHVALAFITMATATLIGRGLRPRSVARRAAAGRDLTWLGPALAGAALFAVIVMAPRMSRALSRFDNLRLIFLDRAPLIGLGVELATRLAPPQPLEVGAVVAQAKSDGRLQIDWRERDILLITVDALRADHVGAYGYPRQTTPAIDKLAREGTLFLHAYCPTPHTSYSVASLMTGKNLHPLLSQGLAADSDTLAGLLRIYGYRTAAFYPPAVFFIDEHHFAPFRDRRLDFEFARIEFAGADERVAAVRNYLGTQPREQRLFLWVHLFEPHEPYVAHPRYPFGDRDVDRYDSEVAFADAAIGGIVDLVRGQRPETVVVVSADHGEEFGDHRGLYHGTTVYEEQVRVPLVVAGGGVPAGRRVESPVQTIDLLPTVLAALDIPRPPRVQGFDIGRWMRGAPASVEGAPPAVSQTDDQILLADQNWRLVCARRAGACSLYDLAQDTAQTRNVAGEHTDRFRAMKTALARIETTQAQYEAQSTTSGERPWPPPIRRGLSGDGEAAREIAELLDDSDVRFRRKAAELLFDLRRRETVDALRLARSRDDDPIVKREATLALARLGESPESAVPLLGDPDRDVKRRAALALAENGDARAGPTLVEWWEAERMPYPLARDVLAAMARLRTTAAVPALIASLDDLRLRPHIARTLAAIGSPAARGPIGERLAEERHKDTRAALALALVDLGAKAELDPPLRRFLGTPEPLPDGVDMAVRAGLISAFGTSERDVKKVAAGEGPITLRVPLDPTPIAAGPGSKATYRILVRGGTADGRAAALDIEACSEKDRPATQRNHPEPAERVSFAFSPGPSRELFADLPPSFIEERARTVCLRVQRPLHLKMEAIAVVPLAEELPPPPPLPWEPPPTELPGLVPSRPGTIAPH
jgi:hypothetical protein